MSSQHSRKIVFKCLVGRYRVRGEKVVVHSGSQTRPETGSLHPVAMRAIVEATRLLKPLVQKVAKGDQASMQAVT